jgi:hypothetical protein
MLQFSRDRLERSNPDQASSRNGPKIRYSYLRSQDVRVADRVGLT